MTVKPRESLGQARGVLVTCAALCASGVLADNAVAAAGARLPPTEMTLASDWRITQDVHDLGEQLGWYQPEPSELINEKTGFEVNFTTDWQAVERLVHLQLLLAPQPYFGRSLRYFNDAPWWYRLEFETPGGGRPATLTFGGVDYFAKVWLNGTLLGEHEGYADPFGFEVGPLLRKGQPNVLVVKVSSPWDHKFIDPTEPVGTVSRNLIKGSYEHADGFVQRDVNPVGIWRPVMLTYHDELRAIEHPRVTTALSEDQQQSTIKIDWSVVNDAQATDVEYVLHLRESDTRHEVATRSRSLKLAHGENALEDSVTLPSPRLWTTWDRGRQPLYEVSTEIVRAQVSKLKAAVTFGIRTVELHRSVNETRFFLNGKPIYLRGTSYWPDLYLSNVDRGRYERDIQAAVRAGFNAFRVHVHTENPEFYEICDRQGMVIIQDNDLNWVFPADTSFAARAVRHFGTLVKQLQNHPSVIAWIAMNEVVWGLVPTLTKELTWSDAKGLGAKLTAEAHRLDATRPVIESSGISNDLDSGDTHDYRGSLFGGASTYFDIYRDPRDSFESPPKLVTEFGVEAPAAPSSLRALPEVSQRLKDVLPRVSELHDYQYRLLKYYIEHYRILKYSPNAGYFQFMWIDFSPQSFMGIYDYWGVPKVEGLGGGIRALQESNQPIGIFMEHDAEPHALYAVNDSSKALGICRALWRVTNSHGTVTEGSQPVQLSADDHQRIRDFTFSVKNSEVYTVVLELEAPNGEVLAHNVYVDPFRPQARPRGEPERIDDEIGMRLWWAGEKRYSGQ